MTNIPEDDPLDWREKYITYEGRDENGNKIYIAWDETSANDIGTFQTWDDAAQALDEYAKTL